MADRAISALNAAEDITQSDLFVIQQGSEAKKASGQLMITKFATMLDGHGGIGSITGPVTSGLEDTYTIHYADASTSAYTVTNGNGIASITGPVTSGLEDSYTIHFDNSAVTTFKVTNGNGIQTPIAWTTTGTPGDGAIHTGTITYTNGQTGEIVVQDGVKGDPGDATYTYVRYASAEPTQDSDMETQPDDWVGIYVGIEDDPDNLHYTDYEWYQYKGDQGDPGEDSEIISQAVEYQSSSSGTTIPMGAWSTAVPVVSGGEYLWTRTTLTFNNSDTPVQSYSVGYMGIDGTGTGDMKTSDYDSGSAVKTAGGIADYITSRISSYDAGIITRQSNISAGDDDDYLLLYSANDSENVKQRKSDFLSDVVAHEALQVTIPSFSTLGTWTAAGVTTDMVVAEAVLSNPAAQTSAWTISTDVANAITISGTISGTTSMTLLLVKPSASVTAS